MTEISRFNTLITEFTNKLSNFFDNEKLRKYVVYLKLIAKVYPEAPVNFFMSSCIKYRDQIQNRDDVFFLTDKSINSKALNYAKFTDQCGLSHYWDSLDDISKNSIWDYIQSLFVLGEIIINKDIEIFNKYNECNYNSKTVATDVTSGNFSMDFINNIYKK